MAQNLSSKKSTKLIFYRLKVKGKNLQNYGIGNCSCEFYPNAKVKFALENFLDGARSRFVEKMWRCPQIARDLLTTVH